MFFFFSSRRRHTRCSRDWSSDVCSSDLAQAVRVALDGADSLKQACWSVVFVETATPPPASGGGRQVTYITRLGVKVYVTPPGLTRDGEITDVQARPAAPREPAGSSGRELAVLFHNSGGLPLWPHGRVEFRRLDNSVAASVDIPEFPVLPGAARRVAIRVPGLPAGRYVALALIDYGGSELAGGRTAQPAPQDAARELGKHPRGADRD